MKSIDVVYLDMDGVLCDFVSATCRVHSVNPKDAYEDWPKGVYELEKVFGLTIQEFWSKIDNEGTWFWENLSCYPWMREMVHVASRVTKSDPILLTSPSLSVGSVTGKLLWIKRRFGDFHQHYAITPKKRLLARPGALLIDDCEKNINEWKDAGGQAILFPQPWNRGIGTFDDVIRSLKSIGERQ